MQTCKYLILSLVCRYLISDQGSLIILQTQSEDQGRYKAIVSNGGGQIVTETQLYFFFESSCRSRCLNGGSCEEISYCRCPESYEGRYCENHVGFVETTSEPLPLPDTPVPSTTEETLFTSTISPFEVDTETPTDDYVIEDQSGSGSESGSESGYESGSESGSGYFSGSGGLENEIGSGNEAELDDDGASLLDDEDFGNLIAAGGAKRRRKRSLIHSPFRQREWHIAHQANKLKDNLMAEEESQIKKASGIISLPSKQHGASNPDNLILEYDDWSDDRDRMLKFER